MARYANVVSTDGEFKRPVMNLVVRVDEKEFEFVIDSSITVAQVTKRVFEMNEGKDIQITVSTRVLRIEEMREVAEQLYTNGIIRTQF